MKLPCWFKVCCEAVHQRHRKHNDQASPYYYLLLCIHNVWSRDVLWRMIDHTFDWWYLCRESAQWRVLSAHWAFTTLHRLRRWLNSSGSVLDLCTLINKPQGRPSLSCSEQLEIWPSCTLKPVPCLSIAQGWRRHRSRILFRSQPPLGGLFLGLLTVRIKRPTLRTSSRSGQKGDGDGLASASLVRRQISASGPMEQHRRGWLVGRDSTPCARSASTSDRFSGRRL